MLLALNPIFTTGFCHMWTIRPKRPLQVQHFVKD